MTDQQLLEMAKAEGFFAAITTPEQVPVDGKFRAFCEENLCGQYHTNYSCPPDCGMVEELHQTLLAEEKVLVIQTSWDIAGYDDKAAIRHAKEKHIAMALRLTKKLNQNGYAGFLCGSGGCTLCDTCKRKEDLPCAHPEQRIRCMSAYCIDVAELAKRCDLEFAWTEDKLHLYGILAFHKIA